MKKKIMLSIALSLMISMIPTSASTPEDESIYVTTQESTEADKFASENVYELVETLAENTHQDLQTIKLGNGILVENPESQLTLNTYFYPVYVNDSFKYVLRVVDNGQSQYIGFLSISAVEEIKKLSSISNYNNPITLYQSNGNLAYFTSHEDGVLIKNTISEENKPDKSIMLSLRKQRNVKTTVDVNETSSIPVVKPVRSREIQPRAYAVLTIDYKEMQSTSSNNWCTAYVSASAARLMLGDSSIRARTIAQYTGAQEKDVIDLPKLVNWWATKGYNFSYYNGQVGAATVATDLSNRRPLWTAYKGYVKGVYIQHALLIHGINGNNYTIWNPWYNYSEAASAINFTYQTANGDTMTMYMFGRHSK